MPSTNISQMSNMLCVPRSVSTDDVKPSHLNPISFVTGVLSHSNFFMSSISALDDTTFNIVIKQHGVETEQAVL